MKPTPRAAPISRDAPARGLRAGIVGYPLSHSRSPELFARLARASRVKVEYKTYPVEPRRLGALVARLKAEGVDGFNVTIPHKEAILPRLDALSREARAIGAVNCVVRRVLKLEGRNYDWSGFLAALRERGLRVLGRRCLLFGAGGAARAVAYALGRSGAREVRIVNRDAARARLLAKDMARLFPKTRFSSRASAADAGRCSLWVNSTPLGMQGFPAASPVPKGWRIPKGAVAYDLVYRPPVTPFLKEARAAGARLVGGLDMLLWQAVSAWAAWSGRVLGTPGSLKRRLADARR